jgi:putative ABC transport system permease protein
MSVIWYKVWYDLWHNPLRTLLVVLSIAVGVFAVGATTGLADQMLPTMDSSHQSTMPSHVTMYLNQPVDLETILTLRKLPGVEEVEALNTIEVRYKLKPQDEWHKANIWMREDYQHQTYDVVQLKAGEWPEGRVLGIERMHSPFYGIDIGDQVILEIDGKPRTFPVTSVIRHPFVPPPMMYDITWFFGDSQVMEMFGIPSGQFTQLRFRVSPYSPVYARLVASTVKDRLANQGIGVTSSVYQDPQKHWGRSFVAGMALVMQVLAIVSMLLSIVLVLNTITALITQQTNQIGIMKAIGGSSFSLTRSYLAGVLVYGLLSLCIALPLGIISSFSITRWFLGLYNVEYESFAFSQKAVIYMIVAALAVPLAAALVPILNGVRITVRQAIASYGLGGDFGSSWIDRLVERIGRRFLASYNAIALANTFRRKGRLVLTQLVLVTAGVMFMMVMTLSSSITATLDAEFDRNTHDIIFNLEEMQRVDRATSLAEQVDGVQKAEMWLVVPVTILREGQKSLDAGTGSALYGMPLDDPMYVPLIVEGRWLEPSDGHAIVMNKQTADDEGIRLGDTISLDMGQWGKADWKVIGLYRVFLMFGGGFSVDAIYAPRPAVFEVTKKTGKASTLLVRTHSHSDEAVNASLRGLEEVFEQRNLDVVQTETIPALRKTYDTSFSYVTSMLMVLAVITAIVGGIGLMGSLWIGVIERTKEIGILRSIGARSTHITNMFVLEAVIQGMMSWLIAVPLSLLVTPLMADALGQAMFQNRLDYQYSFTGMAIWLVIILAISILASAIPARKASQINIRQSLSYE